MKYHNIKCEYDGHKFDSKKEMQRYIQLINDVNVSDVKRQVKFELIPKTHKFRSVSYIADFVYIRDGEEVIEDVKGVETEVFKIKRKLFYYKYGKDITIYK